MIFNCSTNLAFLNVSLCHNWINDFELIKWTNKLTIFTIQESGKYDKQSGKRRLVDEAPVGVSGAERDGSFARVAQPLGQTHHE